MNLTKKNKIIHKQADETIETVEGELIDTPENVSIENRRVKIDKIHRPAEIVTAIGTAAVGLFKLYKMFSGTRVDNRPGKMRKRRRRG
ncbi:MAG: hypothetical protein ABFR36_07885 [Acidobacteriota bacterium]